MDGKMRKLTIYTVMVSYGCPIDKNTTIGYGVSTSDAKIAFVPTKLYRFKSALGFSNNLSVGKKSPTFAVTFIEV